MSKIFIRGEKVDENNIKVTFQHFAPLDKKDGLTEQQLAEGYLVDEIPEPQQVQGSRPILCYNIAEKKCYYTYAEVKHVPQVTLSEVNDKVDLLMQMILESEGLL